MQIVMFTKLFKGRTLDEIASALGELGFDGVDLLIRAGHQLEPADAEQIASAVALFARSGLSAPMATTDITDADDPATAPVLGACADAGIRLIRLGYFRYDPDTGYAGALDVARAKLDGLERLARRLGIKLALQLHGGTIHGSGAQALLLLKNRNPEHIGAYPDPGNQVVQDGREDWRFTFDALKPWLCCIGVKNGGWFAGPLAETGQRSWRSDWLGLADGMVPWDEIFAFLKADGFAAPLTLHSHYEVPFGQALDQTRLDLRYVRRMLGRE